LRVEADGYPVYWDPSLQLPSREMIYRASGSLDLGEIRLQPGVRPIVRVLDASGNRCRGAELYLFEGSELGSVYLMRLGVTDERGEWAATEGLTDDRESLHVLATTPSGWGWTPLALVPKASKADPLEVHIRTSGELAFHVQDEQGAPIAGANVILRTQTYPLGCFASHRSPIGAGSSEPFRARLAAVTDEHGDARIGDLPSDEGAIAWSASIQGPDWREKRVKDLRAVGHGQQVVVLKRQVLVHGVIGKVLDRSGHPIPSAIVRCGKIACRPDATTGAYRLTTPGTASRMLGLDARAPGFLVVTIDANWDAPEDPFVADFVLDAAREVAGIVADSAGRPIADIRLWLRLGSSGGSFSATSAQDGSFRFPPVSEETLALSVDPLDTGAEAWKAQKMDLAPDDRVVHVVLERELDPPRGTLHARIVDALTGAPAPVLSVRIGPDRAHAAFTRMPPLARMVRDVGDLHVRGLADSGWQAWVVSTEGRVARFDFEISPDHRDLEVEVPISPLRSIVGSVRLDGKPFLPPLGGERVSVWAVMPEASFQPSGAMWHEVHTASRRDLRLAEDGTFRIDNLVPSNWLVIVRGAGIECSADVALGVQHDAEIVLDAKR